MAYLGPSQPTLSGVVTNNDDLGLEQNISFGNVAMSGANASRGQAIAVVDKDTGVPALWLYKDGMVGFGSDSRTALLEEGGVQLSLYWGASRIFYANTQSLNLGEKRLDGWRANTATYTTSFSVNSQDSGAVYNNNGASAAITGTLPGPSPSEGHHYWFINTAGQPFSIVPNGADHFIGVSGALSDGAQITLRGQGASIHAMTDTNGDWMILQETGDVYHA